MPATPLDRLPEQLVVFCQAFAEHGSGTQAAISAGVHPDRAPIFARGALRDPSVKAGYEHCVRTRFAEAGPLSLNLLISVVKDAKADLNIRVQAAKTLLDRSGYTAKDMREAEADTRDLKEMSRDELLATLDATEAQLASRAKTLEIAPTIGASAAQVIDIEG